MKKPIIHTTFLADLCDELQFSAFDTGYDKLVISPEWLSNHMEVAFEIIDKNIKRLVDELSKVAEEDDYPIDEVEYLEAEEHLLIDLGILQDLEDVDYATPNHIASSIETLSEKLSEQLQAKTFGEANYNEYYCRRLASVLAELCTLIKEV